MTVEDILMGLMVLRRGMERDAVVNQQIQREILIQLMSDIKIVPYFICPTCNLLFKLKYNLTKHIKIFHSEIKMSAKKATTPAKNGRQSQDQIDFLINQACKIVKMKGIDGCFSDAIGRLVVGILYAFL